MAEGPGVSAAETNGERVGGSQESSREEALGSCGRLCPGAMDGEESFQGVGVCQLFEFQNSLEGIVSVEWKG